jgi:hypothetical protein
MGFVAFVWRMAPAADTRLPIAARHHGHGSGKTDLLRQALATARRGWMKDPWQVQRIEAEQVHGPKAGERLTNELDRY